MTKMTFLTCSRRFWPKFGCTTRVRLKKSRGAKRRGPPEGLIIFEIPPEGLKRAAERSGECGALKIHTRSEKLTARSDLHVHVIVSKLRTRAHTRTHHAHTRTHARTEGARTRTRVPESAHTRI